MTQFNMPPGISTNDIPGNVHADACDICEAYPLNKVCRAIELAEMHTGNRNVPDFGSALLALQDAKSLHMQGNDDHALQRALTSLRYSVGVIHPDYQALIHP